MRKFMLAVLICCVLMAPHLGPKSGINPTSDQIETGIFIGLLIMLLGLFFALIAFFFESDIVSLWIAIAGVIIHIIGLGIYVFYAYPI